MNELALIDTVPHRLSWPDKIAWLAAKIAPLNGVMKERDDFDVRHMFHGEWYIREMELAADQIFIGRPHLQGHIVKLIRGSAYLYYPEIVKRYDALAVLHTAPHFQCLAQTITPVVAQTWHLNPDGCRDIDELESRYFGPAQPVLERGMQLIQEAS